MAFLYPWGNTQQLNLDWIIQKIKELESAPPGAAEITGIANALLALTYNGGTAYDEGDIVYRNEKLYVCNTTIASPGETWNPAHWDEVLLGDAVADLIQKTAGGIVQDVRYNNHKIQQKKAGSYADVITIEDTPSNNSDRLASSKAAYDLKDAINAHDADLAPVLTQLKADTNLVVGDLRVYNNQLYRVTQQVSSGATLIPNTNIVAVNLITANQTYSGVANNYTKMADGTLIQWGETSIELQRTMPQVGSLNLYYDVYTLTFDVPFKDTHYSIYAQSQYGTGFLFPATGNPQSNQDGTSTSATIWFYDVYQRTTGGNALKIRWCAIGRWK